MEKRDLLHRQQKAPSKATKLVNDNRSHIKEVNFISSNGFPLQEIVF